MKKVLLCLTLLSLQLIPLNNKINKKKTTNIKKSSKDKDIYQWLGTYAEVVSLLKEKSFRTVDFPKIFQESLKALLPHVDAHSAFFPKESYQSIMESTSGEFSGIGIIIISKNPEDDTLAVIDVVQDGPSQKAGIKPGDKIIEVNGLKLRGLSSEEVINKIKGKKGTSVNVKIIRNKKPYEFNVKRDTIKDKHSVCYLFEDQNIYYLSLKMFAATATKQLKSLLVKANKGKCNGIIFDLRRNPGGILDVAVDMASLFIEKGSLVVTTKDKNGKTTASYKTKKDPILTRNIPIIILTDNFSASASEILAGCLKHYSEQANQKQNLNVFLVGTTTFGKGSVQEVIPVSNGCALKLTTMLYYLPNDKSIQAVGIEPDFIVNPKTTPTEDIKWIYDLYGKETSLKNYITHEEAEQKEPIKNKNKKDKEKKEKSIQEKQIEALNNDVQIQAGINIINLINFAKKHTPKLVKTRKKALDFLHKNFITDSKIKIKEIK